MPPKLLPITIIARPMLLLTAVVALMFTHASFNPWASAFPAESVVNIAYNVHLVAFPLSIPHNAPANAME